MTRFWVTIARRRHFKIVRFRGHRVQSATIGIAALYWGWIVIDVAPAGAGVRGSGTKRRPRTWAQHRSSNDAGEQELPHNLPVRLIPEPALVNRIRADLNRRQRIGIEAGLPQLDIEVEMLVTLRQDSIAAEREALLPFFDAALAESEPRGGTYVTMSRYRDAHLAAEKARNRAKSRHPQITPMGGGLL